MDLIPNLYKRLQGLCSRKRSRTPSKSEKLIKLKRNSRISPSSARKGLSACKSSVIYSASHLPLTAKHLYKELVHDPTSLSNIKSVVSLLSDVHSQADRYLHSCMEKKYSISTHRLSNTSYTVKKKEAKLEKFLNAKDAKEITTHDIQVLWTSLETHQDDEVFSQISEYRVTYKDVKKLAPGRWLNDEIINSYLKLCKTTENIMIFNTYFYQTLETMQKTQWDKVKLQRILRRAGLDKITAKAYLILPVNLNQMHWVVASINNSAKVIEFYDSMDGSSMEKVCGLLEILLETLGIEAYDWESIATPRQDNGYDCGLFAIKTIQALAKNENFQFNGGDMKYYRKIMLAEIKEGKLFVDY